MQFNLKTSATGNKIALALAATTDWTTYSGTGAIGNDLTKNNSSGFTALPAGDRLGWIGDGYFSGLGYSASFWSSSPTGQFFYLRYNSTTIYHYTSSLNTGYSVRCILD